MVFRSSNTGVSYSSNGSLSMVISQVSAGIVYFTVILSLVMYKKNKKNILYAWINCFLLVLSYFPTGIARFAVAVLYLGAMLTFFTKFRKNRIFVLLFICAYAILLPFLSAFRIESASLNIGNIIRNIFINLVQNWLQFDYDAYTIFTLTLEHVDKFGTFGGIHILSDLLWWVPRSIWPGKALSGSYEVATERNLFSNLSFPFPALGYIDGGVFGLFFLGIIVGLIMKKIDNCYWLKLSENEKSFRAIDILYPCVVIYWFFMCRGDIFYILGYLSCYVIAWWGIVELIKNRKIIFSL